MKVFVKNVEGLKQMPSRANKTDAGNDIIATAEPKIVGESIQRPIDGLPIYKHVRYIEYLTNLFIAPEDLNTHTEIYPRSSVSEKSVVLANSVAVIDWGYRGEIRLRFKYIFQPEDLFIIPETGIYKVYGMVNPEKIYQLGDKIGQLVGKKTFHIEFEKSDTLVLDSTRNEKGFGSSGK